MPCKLKDLQFLKMFVAKTRALVSCNKFSTGKRCLKGTDEGKTSMAMHANIG